ncbi:methyltransferase [Streptomyces sp. NPDC054796]
MTATDGNSDGSSDGNRQGITSGQPSEGAERAALMQMIFGTVAAQTLGAAARLKVAEHLGDGEREAADVAADCAADPGALLRLLRAMTGLGLAIEPRPGVFALTPRGKLLHPRAPGSFATLAQVFTEPLMVRSFERLAQCVRSGEPAFDDTFGTSFFGYLEQHPELSRQFNAAMSEGTRATAAVLPDHYDFGVFSTVVDVGGGDGTLLAAVLRRWPATKGVVYDSAQGLAQAAATMEAAGVVDRFTAVTGDFFASAPEGGDLYLLKSVLHDWNDEQCTTILRHVRDVVPDHGRLLLVEPVLPDTTDPGTALSYLSDLNMLVNLGGRERTARDFTDLCLRAGFTAPTITPLPRPNTFCLIEAAPRTE